MVAVGVRHLMTNLKKKLLIDLISKFVGYIEDDEMRNDILDLLEELELEISGELTDVRTNPNS